MAWGTTQPNQVPERQHFRRANSKLRRAQAEIGCVLGKRGPALLYIVKSDGESNRIGQFRPALPGLKAGLRQGHRQQSSDPTGDRRSHPIRALAGQRMEAVPTRPACTVVLSADAAAERCRRNAGLRQRHHHARQENE